MRSNGRIWYVSLVGFLQFVQIDQQGGRRRFPGQGVDRHGICVALPIRGVNRASVEAEGGDWLTRRGEQSKKSRVNRPHGEKAAS
jgi:hypothetical protein